VRQLIVRHFHRQQSIFDNVFSFYFCDLLVRYPKIAYKGQKLMKPVNSNMATKTKLKIDQLCGMMFVKVR